MMSLDALELLEPSPVPRATSFQPKLKTCAKRAPSKEIQAPDHSAVRSVEGLKELTSSQESGMQNGHIIQTSVMDGKETSLNGKNGLDNGISGRSQRNTTEVNISSPLCTQRSQDINQDTSPMYTTGALHTHTCSSSTRLRGNMLDGEHSSMNHELSSPVDSMVENITPGVLLDSLLNGCISEDILAPKSYELDPAQSDRKLRAKAATQKRKSINGEHGEDVIRSDVEGETSARDTRRNKQKLKCRTIKRTKRVEKVIDPETDPATLTLKQIIRQAEAKEAKKLKEERAKGMVMGGKKVLESCEGTNHRRAVESSVSFVPQVQIIDGQIVINQASLTVETSAKENLETYTKVEEQSSKLNYHSFMKRGPIERWSLEDTERFYQAIGEFGTDFGLIQRIFPERTRNQVKAKYKREEKHNPLRLADTLKNRSKAYVKYEELIKQITEAKEKSPDYEFEYRELNGAKDLEDGYPQETEDGYQPIEEFGVLHNEIKDDSLYL